VETLKEMIARHPFCNGLNPVCFQMLEACAKSEYFEAGQLLFQEGGKADTFYLIRTGQVRLDAFVPSRGTITIQTVSAGAALGWSWLFPPYQWNFSAHTNEKTEVVAFDAQSLRDFSEANHDFGYELIKRVSGVMLQRLQETRLLLVDFYGLPH
jgi:CRP/FNR family transcriptional regulator, cyclic AMP receptor protein